MSRQEIQFREVMKRVKAVRHGRPVLESQQHCLNSWNGPNGSTLEFWFVPSRGTIIAQLFSDGTITTFADWTTGDTWDQFEAMLRTTPQPRLRDGDACPKCHGVILCRETDDGKELRCNECGATTTIP